MVNIDELIKAAMKSKDSVKLRSFKNLKSEIQLFKTAKNAKPYDDVEEIKLISKMCKKLENDILNFSNAGREDLASEYKEELEVLKGLLPEPANESDIMFVLREWARPRGFLIQHKEDTNEYLVPEIPKKEMGNAIKHLKIGFPQADGKMISDIVKKYLI